MEKNVKNPFGEMLEMAVAARSNLYLGGFITDVENKIISGKIEKYREKYEAEWRMNGLNSETR